MNLILIGIIIAILLLLILVINIILAIFDIRNNTYEIVKILENIEKK